MVRNESPVQKDNHDVVRLQDDLSTDFFSLFLLVAFGFTNTETVITPTTVPTSTEIMSAVSENTSKREAITLTPSGTTTLYSVSQDSSGTTATISGKEGLSQAPEGCCSCLGKALGCLQTTRRAPCPLREKRKSPTKYGLCSMLRGP